MFDKMFDDIKGWKEHKFDRRAYLSRIDALPENYRTVYKGIMNYMWSVASDGTAVMGVLMDILDMMENGARENVDVLDMVGDNIIGFCDDILKVLPNATWMEKMKSRRNKEIINQLSK